MICPQCGNEQSDGWLSCLKCHAVFPRPGSRPPSESNSSLPEFSPPPSAAAGKADAVSRRRPAKTPLINILVTLFFILFFALALLWVLFPKGKPVRPGAYRDHANGFAFNPPEGWEKSDPESERQSVNRARDFLPPSLTGQVRSGNSLVSFGLALEENQFQPNLNLIRAPATPPIDEKTGRALGRAVANALSPAIQNLRLDSAIVMVDGLKSLKLEYTGTLVINARNRPHASVPTPGQDSELAFRLHFQQFFIPVREKTFILSLEASQHQWDDLAAEFASLIDSFRVLKRPRRFRSVVQGGVVGGLAGALIYLLSLLYRLLSERRE